jgi:hypothetical protein
MGKFGFLKEVCGTWFDKTVPYPVPDPNGLQGQCVQFIRWILAAFLKLPQWKAVRGAADFWAAYENDPAMNQYWDKIPNTPDFVPQEGDICVWDRNKGGGYGHIGFVYEDDHTVKYFYCIEANWKPLKVTVAQHNYNNASGFLRLKGLECGKN